MIKLEPTITRGHLNPAALNSFNADFRRATFTLTNAAPMFEAMNKGAWAKYEGRIRQYAKCPCGSVRKGTLYLLTGTSNYGITKRIDTGEIVQVTDADPTFQTRPLPTGKSGKTTNLQIPRAIWTAGCCVWMEKKEVSGSTQDVTRAESFAVMCNNEKDPDNVLLAEMSVAKVELMLTDPRKGRVNLFPNFPGCRVPDNPDFELPL